MRRDAKDRWGRWVSVAGDLLLGAECPGCAVAGVGLCADCRTRLHATEPYPASPTPRPAGFPPTVAGGPYDDLLRNLISAHKERQAWLLTPALAERLARTVAVLLADAPRGQVWLVPVPSSPQAVRSRGRDATAAIAAAAARRLGDRHHPATMARLIRPVRRLADQSGLTADQRRANLSGAYAVIASRRPRRPGSVIIVDDLVTTGASIAEAARVLAQAGLDVLGAAVVAATVRRNRAPYGVPNNLYL